MLRFTYSSRAISKNVTQVE